MLNEKGRQKFIEYVESQIKMAGNPDINYVFKNPNTKTNYFSKSGKGVLPKNKYESAKIKINAVLHGVIPLNEIHDHPLEELSKKLEGKPTLAFKKGYDELLYKNGLIRVNSKKHMLRLYRCYILYNKREPVSATKYSHHVIESRLEGSYRIKPSRISHVLLKSDWFNRIVPENYGKKGNEYILWDLTEKGIAGEF
jgi:hypothetical protein